MAKVYVHNKRGFQIRYTIYLPDGARNVKFRYSQTREGAESLLRKCQYLESGSRANNLSPREVSTARHDDLISEAEAMALSGGQRSVAYDLDLVFAAYKISSAVANTPYGHLINMRRAAFIKDWFRDNPIPTLTAQDVKLYILQRQSGERVHRANRTWAKIGVSAKTVKNEMEIIRTFIDEAIALGMVATNVAREIDVPVKTSKIRRSVTRSEMPPLLKAADKNRHLLHGQMYEALMIDLYTGMRRGELRTLEWTDIFFEARKIGVQSKVLPGEEEFTTKSGEARLIDMPDGLYEILTTMERYGRFVLGGEQPYSLAVISGAFKTLLRRAGLPENLSLHHIRHTYLSWLLVQTKGNLKYVQEQGGHANMSTTMGYTHGIEDIIVPAKDLNYQ